MLLLLSLMMMLLLLLLPESRSDEMATRNDERAAAVRAMSGTVQREPRFFMSDLRLQYVQVIFHPVSRIIARYVRLD